MWAARTLNWDVMMRWQLGGHGEEQGHSIQGTLSRQIRRRRGVRPATADLEGLQTGSFLQPDAGRLHRRVESMDKGRSDALGCRRRMGARRLGENEVKHGTAS